MYLNQLQFQLAQHATLNLSNKLSKLQAAAATLATHATLAVAVDSADLVAAELAVADSVVLDSAADLAADFFHDLADCCSLVDLSVALLLSMATMQALITKP